MFEKTQFSTGLKRFKFNQRYSICPLQNASPLSLCCYYLHTDTNNKIEAIQVSSQLASNQDRGFSLQVYKVISEEILIQYILYRL